MNDPHVEKLYYRVVHGEMVDYDHAEPAAHPFQGFDVQIARDRVTFTMHEHFATEIEARDHVEEFVAAWNVWSGLEEGPGMFQLEYLHAEMIDRNPPPGIVVVLGSGSISVTADAVKLCVSRSRFPAPPGGKFVRSKYVAAMYYQYEGLCAGRMPHAMVGYFCLTVLESSSGAKPGASKREAAATKYTIALKVLNKLGNLTSEAGGLEARKAVSDHKKGRGAVIAMNRPYTDREREWIKETVRLLTKRLGEHAARPTETFKKLEMADLPPLKGH